jgi:predicted Zn-dependent peptidase
MRLRGRISLRHPREPVREVLPNGVVLIAQEHRASDVVALQLWMRMGGRDEAAG